MLQFVPAADLNQGEDGIARSVRVRLYQLADPGSLMSAHSSELWEGDGKEALGASLLAGPDELRLVPGATTTFRLQRDPQATYLGAVAKFRREDGQPRLVIPLPSPRNPCEQTEGVAEAARVVIIARDAELWMEGQP